MFGRYKKIITVEDNSVAGGFGSSLLELASNKNMTNTAIKILGLPDRFIEHGTIAELKRKYGLDEQSLFQTFKEFY